MPEKLIHLICREFDRLCETPDAPAKLRAFVLRLGVQGQLTRMEPAVKEWALKPDTTLKQNGGEPPFRLPEHWRWARLNDVADYRAAEKVEPADIRPSAWVLDLEEVEKDTSRILKFAEFREKQSTSTKAKFLAGDVLYGKLRPYLNKVVVAPREGFCTTEIVPIRSRGLINPSYLCIFLRSPDFVDYANEKSYGMKMPRLGTEDAEKAWIPVPPPPEQHRIVAKVEELLALCDELEARQTTARDKRTHVTHSALAHLTSAKDEHDFKTHANFILLKSPFILENVPALREAILSLAVQGYIVPHEQGGAMIRGIKFEDIIEDSRYGTAKKCHYQAEGTAVLRIPNVVSGKIDLSDLKRTELTKKEKADLSLKKGDLLVVRSNGSVSLVGQAAVITQECAGSAFAGYLVRIRLRLGEADPEFVQLALSSSLVRQQIEMPIRTTSGVKNINTQEIYRITFPLPPLAEQQRIVSKVDELMRWCDALEARLTYAQTSANHLLDATLHQILKPAL